ncbi:receptor-like protein 53 [Malania oleifera]|uniref:receptor-like protein 53 n=1 Tax=Malania oleifera TaxID=397392 RepID=UPI0025AE31F5|nr:receptor-like protein 53 [Malania oleifera]
MGRICFWAFSLFLLVSVAQLFFPAVDSKTYWEDIEALKELKNGLDRGSVSPGSCLSSWNFTVDPCDNLFGERFTCGFRCDVVVSGTSRVTELSLDQAGYAGNLTSAALNLPYLETLDLSGNYFAGSIPDSLPNLTRLRRLGLSTNSFSGEIPASIGSLSNLEELALDSNGFQGTIPASLNGLTRLKRLQLQANKLSGEFPDLSSLKNLFLLDASDNAISGKLPANFPPSVVQISMRNNNLSGLIPEKSIEHLGSLQVMDLSNNILTGAVPSVLFTHPSLQQLTLSFNRFSSVQEPGKTAAGKSGLIAVDISNNELRGLLPAFLGLMPKLTAVSLEKNKFTGMVPIGYALKAVFPGAGVSPLGRLLLGGNYLFGPIPSPLKQLKAEQATVTLDDNCLYSCPLTFFFCQGAEQKPLRVCRKFGPVIPRSL